MSWLNLNKKFCFVATLFLGYGSGLILQHSIRDFSSERNDTMEKETTQEIQTEEIYVDNDLDQQDSYETETINENQNDYISKKNDSEEITKILKQYEYIDDFKNLYNFYYNTDSIEYTEEEYEEKYNLWYTGEDYQSIELSSTGRLYLNDENNDKKDILDGQWKDLDGWIYTFNSSENKYEISVADKVVEKGYYTFSQKESDKESYNYSIYSIPDDIKSKFILTIPNERQKDSLDSFDIYSQSGEYITQIIRYNETNPEQVLRKKMEGIWKISGDEKYIKIVNNTYILYEFTQANTKERHYTYKVSDISLKKMSCIVNIYNNSDEQKNTEEASFTIKIAEDGDVEIYDDNGIYIEKMYKVDESELQKLLNINR